MKSINVYYDPQQGSYFKIDKNTGQTIRSHRNGSDFAKFKPEYTGADYRIRKENQRDLSPSCLNRKIFQVNYEHKHTTPIKSPKVKRQAKSQISITTSLPFSDSRSNLLALSRMLQSKMVPTSPDMLTNKLKQYSKIRQDLKRQNHSPRSGYQGSIKTNQQVGGSIRIQKEEKQSNKNKQHNINLLSNRTEEPVTKITLDLPQIQWIIQTTTQLKTIKITSIEEDKSQNFIKLIHQQKQQINQ